MEVKDNKAGERALIKSMKGWEKHKKELLEGDWWKAISGPEVEDTLCPQCGLYLVVVGEKICRTCAHSDMMKKEFEEHDKLKRRTMQSLQQRKGSLV